MSGCSGPQQAIVAADAMPHLGPTWFSYRAQTLGIDAEAAKARDGALPEDAPPADAVFDRALAEESALIWREQCARCHGLNGRLEGVPPMEPEPKRWGGMGPQMGFFFGGDKMRAGIYRSIADGKKAESGKITMPAWRGVLSREQMWGLVRHIEGF